MTEIKKKSHRNSTKNNYACLLCKRPDRVDLERSWFLGEKTITQISTKLNCSKTLISRHMKRHFSKKPKDLHDIIDSGSLDMPTELIKLLNRCNTYLDDAENSQDMYGKKAFINETRQTLKTIGDVQDKMNKLNMQTNVFNNTQITEIINTVLVCLEPFPDARISCAKALEAKGL